MCILNLPETPWIPSAVHSLSFLEYLFVATMQILSLPFFEMASACLQVAVGKQYIGTSLFSPSPAMLCSELKSRQANQQQAAVHTNPFHQETAIPSSRKATGKDDKVPQSFSPGGMIKLQELRWWKFPAMGATMEF